MATVSAIRSASSSPVPNTGALRVAWGTYTHATNLVATTIIEYCRLPRGAVVVGGYFAATDLDSGTGVIDIDIGWAANGDVAASTDGLGNLGALPGTTSVHLGAVGIWMPIQNTLFSGGPITFNAETTIQGVVNVAANAGGTGTSTVVIYFYVP